MNGKENSYVLYFKIEENEELRKLQEKIYKVLPSQNYNPEKFGFHITIHIDKNYDKIKEMKEKILESFVPFELKIDAYNLYELWNSKLVKTFKGEMKE